MTEALIPYWSIIYTTLFLISFVTTVLAVFSLAKHAKVVASCVYHATFWFFIWKTVYALARIVLLAVIIEQFRSKNDHWIGVSDREFDVGAARFFGFDQKSEKTPFAVELLLFVGDGSLLCSVLWMIVLVVELIRLTVRHINRRPSSLLVRHDKTYLSCIDVKIMSLYG